MAKNIFSMFQGYVPKPKRNVFDLSFNNNFTTKFGQLTPVLCKEVIPGDSFKIETAAGLRLMPMAFPVQTPMKAYIHYFYVRNRALWKDWQDFITGTKDNLVPPYINFGMYSDEQKRNFLKVGGIADYFGVPNVLYSTETSSTISETPVIGANNYIVIDDSEKVVSYLPFKTTKWVDWNFLPYATYHSNVDGEEWTAQEVVSVAQSLSNRVVGTSAFSAFSQLNPNNYPNPWNAVKTLNSDVVDVDDLRICPWVYVGRIDSTGNLGSNVAKISYSSKYNAFNIVPVIKVVRDSNGVITSVTGNLVEASNLNDGVNINSSFEVSTLGVDSSHSVEFYIQLYSVRRLNGTTAGGQHFDVDLNYSIKNDSSITLEYGLPTQGLYSVIGDGDLTSTPYDSDIHLSALPFRAYECIYNSYYRNMQNNPYILNGVEEYNKFIPSNDGGADSNVYSLHQRNWEYDFMTSAVPSPQFGVAPLVGITMTGTATFQDENGTTYYAQAELDDDGVITGWSTHSSNMPAGTLRMLMDNVGTGISINDLRNVNSFQRFLENSLRVGLKYRDQIKGHFGVDVRYDELEMPEFIGGMSLDINVNQVTQTADVSDSSYPLAGFAGQAGAFGSSKHAVTKYCDEHGFIIGILSVVPVPVYSQLLPKFFMKNEMLDYYYPEFGHVGYQPILQKEISPLQSYYTASDLNNVFGYQRAWYDYISSTDEVHSQFRTTLRDFVMNRTFENVPALNESFLLVDPEQVNDVFLVTSDGEYGPDADKILGQLYFKITKKSPIPILGIPRLTD